MVCLCGMTYDAVKASLSPDEQNEFPIWNWISYLLTKYIMKKYSKKDILEVPTANDNSYFAHWFRNSIRVLKEIFNDATPERVLKCLNNPPSEEIAWAIYEATSLEMQREFLGSLKPYKDNFKANTIKWENLPNKINPADNIHTLSTKIEKPQYIILPPPFSATENDASFESEGSSDEYYDSDTDSDMPDLEPQTPTIQEANVFTNSDINIVMGFTHTSKFQAMKALHANKGNIVNAVIEINMLPPHPTPPQKIISV